MSKCATVFRVVLVIVLLALVADGVVAQPKQYPEAAWSLMSKLKSDPATRDRGSRPQILKSKPIHPYSVMTPINEADVRVHPTTNTSQSEFSMAVSPLDKNILLASSNASDFPVTQIYGTGAYWSTDGGITWSGFDQPPSGNGNQGDPASAIGRNGYFYVGSIAPNEGQGLMRSTNGGVSWNYIQISNPNGDLLDKNHLTIDNSITSPFQGNLYAGWTDFGQSGPSPIEVARSTDNGATWVNTQNISGTMGSEYAQGVNMQTGPNGEVYACWAINQDVSPFTEKNIGFNKSTDGGITWGAGSRPITNINGIRSTAFSPYNIRVNSFPSMAVSMVTGNIYIVWANIGVPGVNTGDADIYLIKSTNGGSSWSSPIRVNDDAINNGAKQFFPWISVDPLTDDISVIFYDGRNHTVTNTSMVQVTVAHSIDGGTTWENFTVSDNDFTLGPLPGFGGNYAGDYLGIDGHGGKSYPFWMSQVPSTNSQGWISPVQYPTNFGFVKGTVNSVASSSAPLTGVLVDFSDATIQQQGVTDANGNYRVGASVDTNTQASLYTLRAQKFGYLTYTDTITLTLGDTLTRDLTLNPAPGGTLSVHSYMTGGAPVRSNVRIQFNGFEVINEFTDSINGMFSTPLPVGSYDVTVDPPSPFGTRFFEDVAITEGVTTPIDALVRYVVEPAPTALYDTLGAGQSNTVTLTLTNTTADSVPFRISNDETMFNGLTNLPQFDPGSPSQDPLLVVGKEEHDPRYGPTQIYDKGGPDEFGYVWIDSDEPGGPTFNWVDITSVGTPITTWTGSQDDGHYILTLPFSFPFYGNTYTSARIGTNGFVAFDVASSTYGATNDAIPSTVAPNDGIYGFWDDLDSTAGRVFYYHDAANSRFIVQYNNVPHYTTGSPVGRYTFEIILYPNGNVVTQYFDMQGALESASIGIENSTGTDGLQVAFNSAYVQNNLAILFKLRGVDWLAHDPAFGAIPPNSSVNITNTFDAEDLIPGTSYFADIFVDATHPDVSGSITVPSTLRVEPLNGPGINVRPLSKNFGDVIIYQSKTDSVLIRNIGTLQLDIVEVASSNAQFTYSLANNAIPSGDSAKLYITYSPLLPAGTATGAISILSNDPLNDTVIVSVSGTAIGVPHVYSSSSILDKTIEGGVEDSIQFMVGNDGTLDADYQARAVMYSTEASAGRETSPIILPMKITKKGKDNQHQLFADNSPSKDPNLAVGKNETDPRFGPPQTFGQGGPDSAGYTWIDSEEPAGPTFNWFEINSLGTAITSWTGSADDGRASVNLPFNFPFYGTSYNTVSLVTNGFMQFTGTSTAYLNTAIPATAAPNNSIYPFWDDYDLRTSGQVYTYNDVTNSRFIIEYDHVPHYLAPIGTQEPGLYTYQVILYPNGTILVQYLDMQQTLNSATIGIENSSGTDGLQVVYNNNYVQNNFALMFLPPGITPPGGGGPWLSINPASGSVSMNDSTQLTATFDATSADIYNNPGDYYGRIEITATNSALAESLNIPAHMFVIPAAGPRLSVDMDSLGFGNVEIGQNAVRSVLVKNIGSGTLQVTGITMTNGNFSASPTTFTLASLDTQRVTVRFTAPTPGGVQYGTMTFTSNDASAPDVQLGGRSIGVPHITATPDSFYVLHPSGTDTMTQNLTIQNNGTDTLHFKIEETGTGAFTEALSPPNNEPAYELPKGAIDPRHSAAQILGSGGPDAFGYHWIDSDEPGGPTFNWVDITSVGTPVAWSAGNADEGYSIIALPFAFSFYGNSYSSVRLTSNGTLSFDVATSTTTSFSNTTIPGSGFPNNAIFGFWDDIDTEISGAVYTYNDVANNRFIVEFYNAPHYGTEEPGVYTFQMILYPNGNIVVQYLDMQQTVNSASIGIENSTGTVGLQVVYDNTYVHNNLALLFTSDLYPWLSTSVTSGSLAPNASQVVQVRTHPGTQLTAGTYNGKLVVTGNTSDTERVAVRMDVTGGTAYVQVTAPNGGESYIAGQTYNITWNANLVDSVKLEYSTDAGSTWNLISSAVPALKAVDVRHPKVTVSATEIVGSYLWTVPSTPTTQGRVRVSDKNNSSTSDMSNGNFTITSTPPATWATSTSGTTSALYAVSIVSDQVAWVAGDAGVVRYTTNGGTSWNAAAVPLAGQPIHNIFAIDANIAFVSINTSAGNDGRIYRTTTGGTSWQMVYQNTGTGAFINAVYMFDPDSGMAIGDPVSSQWNILKTTNGGSSWFAYGTLAQSGSEAGWNNSFEWRDNLRGWFGTSNSRVYSTTNGGASWLYSATPSANSYGVSFINNQLGMVGAATGATAASTNGGGAWTATAAAGSGAALFPAGVSVPTQRWWMASGASVYKTTNQGSSWAVDHSRAGVFNHIAMRVQTDAGVIVGYAVGASGQISKYVEYLPILSGTIAGMKFEDLNANGVKESGEPGLSGWQINLSGDAVGSTVTDANGNYGFADVSAGSYIVTETMQAGWYRSLPVSGSYEVSLAVGENSSNNNFGNYRMASIAGTKYEDADGDSVDTDDSGISGWTIYLSGSQSDTVVTDSSGDYSFAGLMPGTYTLTEKAEAGWVVTEPAGDSYQMTVQSGQALTGYNFGNFELGSISGTAWKDIDGNGIKDAGEPAAANWVIHAEGAAPGNSHQQSTDANGNYTFDHLFADTYTVTEDLESGFTQTYPPGGSYSLTIGSGDQLSGKDFGNYNSDTSSFCTFSADSIALARDGKGKIGKPMAKKGDRVTFKFNLVAPNGPFHFLRLDFSASVRAIIYRGTDKVDSIGVMNGKRFGPVNLPISNGETIQVEGFGSSTKPVRVTYQWNSLPKVILAQNQFLVNKVGLPLPNPINLIAEMYQQGSFGAGGLKVGTPLSGGLALRYGWAEITKLTDALKSFYDAGQRHTAAPGPFDLIGAKLFVGKQKMVSPKKHNNKLFAELAALKINIVSSAAGKTPVGFGDLIFDDGTNSAFCNRSVMQIAASADSFITFGILQHDSVAAKYYAIARMLNTSFEGKIDTVSFASKLKLKGTRRLYDVPFLQLNTTGERTTIAESDFAIEQLPTEFSLEQNYPNPFNPTTTIRFSLPEDGVVTLHVFDLLGREVASLVNREEMAAGEYEYEFIANNLVSGVYFYRISVEVPNDEVGDEIGVMGTKTFYDVKKLLLMK